MLKKGTKLADTTSFYQAKYRLVNGVTVDKVTNPLIVDEENATKRGSRVSFKSFVAVIQRLSLIKWDPSAKKNMRMSVKLFGSLPKGIHR